MASPNAARPEAKETLPNPDPRYDLLAAIPQEWFRLRVTGQDLSEVMHSVKGYYVDEDHEFVKETADVRNVVSPIRIITGREFVGFPSLRRSGIYRKRWQWGVYFPKAEGEDAKNPEYQPKMHDREIISTFPFVSSYPLIFSAVDVQGRSDPKFKEAAITQIVFKTFIRVRMLRPRIALMQNTDWLGSGVSQLIRAGILDFVRDKTYDDLVRKKDDFNRAGSDFRKFFIGTSINNGRQIQRSRLRKSILAQYGVDVIDFNLVDIDANAAFEKQLQDLANADVEAEIIIRKARAEQEKRGLEAKGEEAYIRATSEALRDRLKDLSQSLNGDLASLRAIEYAYALRDSKITTFAGNGLGIVIGPDGKIA